MSTLLSHIRANRRELRARGVTPSGLLLLESIAFKAVNGAVRLSVAALGRMIGVSRSVALRHIQKLEAIGAVVRVGPSIALNTRGVLKWCADGCKNRASALKSLYIKRKSKCVAYSTTHRGNKYPSSLSQALDCDIPCRKKAAEELKALYIPVHLRKSHNI